jgi:hypothetical protein
MSSRDAASPVLWFGPLPVFVTMCGNICRGAPKTAYSNIIANTLVISVCLCPSLLRAEALDIEACHGLQAYVWLSKYYLQIPLFTSYRRDQLIGRNFSEKSLSNPSLLVSAET